MYTELTSYDPETNIHTIANIGECCVCLKEDVVRVYQKSGEKSTVVPENGILCFNCLMDVLKNRVKPKDTFIASDQPETCRYCGVRTEILEITKDKQKHMCPKCNIIYTVMFE